MSRLSLRGLLSGSAVALLALALLATASLVFITSRMTANTAAMWRAMESVYHAGEIELSLLRHSRERRLFGLTGEPHHAVLMQQEQEDLYRLLSEAQHLVGSPEEAAVLDDLRIHTTEYLELTSRLVAEGGRNLAGDAQMVSAALPTAARLVKINLADADVALRRSQRWDRAANALGATVAALLLSGILASIWIVRRDVYQPLVAIRGALVRFHLGNTGGAAPETGATELREIAGEFNRMTRRLQHQREIQLGFVAGVAHDLRNPLSVLKLSASVMRPDRPLPPEATLRGRLEVVTKQVCQIERMVEDLLDTAQIEAGHLSLQLGEHDLVTLVREAVALHEGVSAAHRLVFHPTTDGPALVRCDATRIAQVLNNLLGNAIKYSPGGGEVQVALTTSPGAVRVAVTDAGIGIPMTELESIFEPFRRSSNSHGTIPGVGLGLAVARRILLAQGGTIEVESVVGRGTTFRFDLPRSEGAPAGGQRDAATAAAPAS